MTRNDQVRLDSNQLEALHKSLHRGSVEASQALATWIGKPSVVEIDSLEQLPLEEATGILNANEDPVCFCSTELSGLLTGQMILVFDDSSGLSLADMLLDRPPGTSQQWDELETSAAIETTNILCCWYLNALSSSISDSAKSAEIMPSPPVFARDFAESLMEFTLMGQAVTGHQVVLARTRFEIAGMPVNWTLLLIPDAQSMSRLAQLLSTTAPHRTET